jgi:hypothetical protein
MDNLLVGNLSSPVNQLREAVCRVMSSVALPPCGKRSGIIVIIIPEIAIKLITISSESMIIFSPES